jgi:hypothetical protein
MAKQSSAYQKRTEGDVTVFNVTPASCPKFGYLIFIGVVVILLGFGMMGGNSGGGSSIFMFLMGGIALWYGWFRDQRPKPHRVPSTFRVGTDFVETGGRRIMKGDIHRLQLRNGITDQELPGISVYTSNTNEAAGMAQRAKVSMVANSLTVESGGKSTMLAGGMDQTTAYGLLHEVSKLLDFNIT